MFNITIKLKLRIRITSHLVAKRLNIDDQHLAHLQRIAK